MKIENLFSKNKNLFAAVMASAFVILAFVAALCFMPKTEANAATSTMAGKFVYSFPKTFTFTLTENIQVSTDNKIALYGVKFNTSDAGTVRGAGTRIEEKTVSGSSSTLSAGTYWTFELPESFSYSTASFVLEFTGTYWGTKYSEVINVKTPVALPEEPVQEGHHFAGWYYDEDFTRPYDNEPIYADTTLYAKMEINIYSVTYDSAGGSSVENVTVEWNNKAPVPAPTRTGYDFVGWFTADGEQYNGEAVVADLNLTARWAVQTFTVTFMLGEAVYKSVTVEYGTRLIDAMELASLSSYSASTLQGVRYSKSSLITENADVLVTKLSGMEKFGDYVGTHEWVIFAFVAVLASLAITSAVAITVAVKRR